MGRNRQQRRAQKQPLADDDTHAVVEEMITLACGFAYGTRADKAYFAKLIDALYKREEQQDLVERPSAVVTRRLQNVIDALFESGWQPADLVHTVKREWVFTIRAPAWFAAEPVTSCRHGHEPSASTRKRQLLPRFKSSLSYKIHITCRS